jgi:hypothetical protein
MERAGAAKTSRVDREQAKRDKRELVAFAKRAMHGLDESHAFVGIFDDREDLSESRVEFFLQLGYSIMLNKVIIIPCPFGYTLPPKLAQIADYVVRYDPARLETLEQNLAVALTEMGINIQ